MSTRAENIETVPPTAGVEFLRVPRLREPFRKGVTAMEQLITLARSMPPRDAGGDWGSWFYHGGFGEGTLYVPFGSDGLSAVSLSCGGDIGDDSITKALFAGGVAHWSEVRKVGSNETQFTYILIAKEAGRLAMRNHPEEPNKRQYFGYQNIDVGMAQIEQFGSNDIGFFEVKGLGDENIKIKVPSGYGDNPAYLNIHKLSYFLNLRKNTGIVGPISDLLNSYDIM